jgi:diguanylate cyclase (GGDEF)-like protein
MSEKQPIDWLQRGHNKAVNNLVIAGSALVVSSVLLILFLSLMMRSELIDDCIVQTNMVASNSNAALLFDDEKTGQEILSSLATSPSFKSGAIYYISGEVLARYSQDGNAPLETLPNRSASGNHTFSARHLEVTREISSNEKAIGFVALQFGLTQFYHRLAGYSALILGVALGALLIVQLFLSRMKITVNRAELHLDYLAHSDPVTSLPNRRAFNRGLEDALSAAAHTGGEVGLIMMDLDNFKVVNDTMGHQYGDEILRLVAQRLITSSRSNDIVCRTGGDEFVIIMREINESIVDLDTIAKRIVNVLSDPFHLGEHEFFLTASAGSSLYPIDAADSETLIRKADTAMYSAKQSGKNTFAKFTPEMDTSAQRRMVLEGGLRKSLINQELMLHYQPQVALNSGKIVGVEALLRWYHPELGSVSPTEFIPVAEESGLIVDIGQWVLQTACLQMADWITNGIAPIRVAVNLSIRQLKEQRLMQNIHSILDLSGLPPSLLELEITEGIMMENVQENIVLLKNIREAGIILSIDDFGTGYSSLSYLKRFPVDLLKIDRSFISDLPGEGKAFITAIIAMAHSLGLSVIAEGVETDAQMRFLKEVGCDMAQGYYFARPKSPSQLLDMLREGYIEIPPLF